MRTGLVLVFALSTLLAFGVACGDDDEKTPVTSRPVIGSEDGTQEAGAGGGQEWDEGDESEGGGEAEEEAGEEGTEAGGADGGDGDGAEADEDDDGVPDGDDNCPEISNPDQEDLDSDLAGDVCDDDDDNDGFSDGQETVVGSDPLDDASVPENHVVNPGSCMDGVDNDGDGLIDGPDPNCPSGPRGLSASLGVTPRNYDGSCPVDLTFAGIITLASGRGTVTYAFVRSDSGVGAAHTLAFDSPGTRDVNTEWQVGAPGVAFPLSGWMAIRVLEPEELESNRANFTVTCED